MRTGLYGGCIAVGLLALFGCESFNGSGRSMRAVVGGGAVAGRDYVRGLTPSTAAREWFIQNDLDSSTSVMVRRGDDENTTGVRFVANGGIEIPPGAAITYENKGYCLDPHLPAPREGHEFQLVPVSCLIPEGLQGIYDKLVTCAANGDSAVMSNMQHLMWALRTAGTDAAYANNLTSEQRRILDSCSEYAGEFEDFCSNERARAQLLGWLIAKVDARLNINIGGVSYKASDLLDPDVGAKKIDAHLQQLIDLGEMVPIEHIGFNYGELEKGIYTDVMGTGPLKFRATVANATSQPFVFYPQRYVGQAGSDVSLSSSAITFSATANDAKVQRVTSGPVDEVGVVNREESPQDKDTCKHVWHAWSRVQGKDKSITKNLIAEYEKKKQLRTQYRDEIVQMRNEITKRMNKLDLEPGMEYGAVIYLKNNTIESSMITMGQRDWQIYGKDDKQQVRTTKRNGWYYRYKNGENGIPTGEVDYTTYYQDEYCGFDHTKVDIVETGSWNLGDTLRALPNGVIALEYTHLHPKGTDRHLSYQDIVAAINNGLNGTVILPGKFIPSRLHELFGGWRNMSDMTYEPDHSAFRDAFSDSYGRESLSVMYDHAQSIGSETTLVSLRKNYFIQCVKCGMEMDWSFSNSIWK